MIPLWVFGGAAAICVASGLVGGWTIRDWKAGADELAATAKVEKIRDTLQAKIYADANKYEQWRDAQSTVRVESRNTIREVFRNVPVRVDCAAPDTVRVLLDSKVETANAAAAGEFSFSVLTSGEAAKPVGRPR